MKFKSKKLCLLALFLVSSLTACKSKETVDSLESSPAIESSAEDKFAISDNLNTDLQATEPETRDPMETAIAIISETLPGGGASGYLANGEVFVQLARPGSLASDTVLETEVEPTGAVKEIADALSTSESEADSANNTDSTPSTEETKPMTQKAEVKDDQYLANAGVQLTEEESFSYDNIVTAWVTFPDLSEDYLYQTIGSQDIFPSLTDTERSSLIEEIKTVYPHDPAETVAYDETYWDTHY